MNLHESPPIEVRLQFEPGERTAEELHEVARLIRAGREEIIRHGWGQGQARDDAGHLCLLGSLDAARYSDRSLFRVPIMEPTDWLEVVIKEQFPDRESFLHCRTIAFNDHESTTVDDVLAVMEKTAIRLEEQA